MKKKIRVKKKPDQPYTISFSEKEREQYEKFRKKQGYKTLSRLIRYSLDVVMRDPKLLEVTEKNSFSEGKEILKELREARISAYEELTNIVGRNSKKLEEIGKLVEMMLLKKEISEEEIRKLKHDDLSGEEVFK